MTMLRTLLISLVLVAAAITLAAGGVRGMSDGGLRGSVGITILADESPTGMSDGGL
ncbi:MAG TPA: hypothetical protein VGQ15_04350 [Gaiellaceae bacterium]|jgi:hypothetical protein|nr:hypothetical protein [Gaiellaceae bacterium]